MNKKLLFIASAICFIVFGKANAQLKMQSGKTDMWFKVGAPLLQTSKFNDAGLDDFKASTPAIGIGFETGFFDNISCGFEINYSTYKNDNNVVLLGGTGAHYTGDMTVYNVMVFAKYFTPIKFAKLATYARVDFLPLAAYKKNRTTEFSTGVKTFTNDNGVKATYGIYAGGNYQLAGPLSAFAEVGYGFTAINAGISLRIGDK